MVELAGKWAAMSAEERKPYKAPPPEAIAEPAAPLKPQQPFPYIGDDVYPVAAEHLGDIPSRVAEESQKWQKEYDKTIKPSAPIEPQRARHCEEKWGCCQEDLTKAEQRSLNGYRLRMKSSAIVFKMPTGTYDSDWGKLTLLYAGPRPDEPAGAADDVRGFLLLHIFNQSKPAQQVYCSKRGACPAVGDTISFIEDLAQSCIKHDTILMHDFHEIVSSGRSLVFRRIVYTQVALLRYLVTAIEDPAEAERAHAVAVAAKRQRKQLADLVAGRECAPKPRKRARTASLKGGGGSFCLERAHPYRPIDL